MYNVCSQGIKQNESCLLLFFFLFLWKVTVSKLCVVRTLDLGMESTLCHLPAV